MGLIFLNSLRDFFLELTRQENHLSGVDILRTLISIVPADPIFSLFSPFSPQVLAASCFFETRAIDCR